MGLTVGQAPCEHSPPPPPPPPGGLASFTRMVLPMNSAQEDRSARVKLARVFQQAQACTHTHWHPLSFILPVLFSSIMAWLAALVSMVTKPKPRGRPA